MATATELKDKLTARLEQIERFKTFKPEKVEKDILEAKEEIQAQLEEVGKKEADLAAFYSFIGEAIPNQGKGPSDEEVQGKIKAVMLRFPNGANGRDLANAIKDYRITSDTISDVYWKEGQTFLKKGKNAKGIVEGGAKTRYLLATAVDKAEIEADQKAEEALEAKRKAKREAAKK